MRKAIGKSIWKGTLNINYSFLFGRLCGFLFSTPWSHQHFQSPFWLSSFDIGIIKTPNSWLSC
jgi:hypothetical protein